MPKICHIPFGPYGSGKSTFIREKLGGMPVVYTDKIAVEYEAKHDCVNIDLIHVEKLRQIEELCNSGVEFAIKDANFLYQNAQAETASRKKLFSVLDKYGYECIAHDLSGYNVRGSVLNNREYINADWVLCQTVNVNPLKQEEYSRLTIIKETPYQRKTSKKKILVLSMSCNIDSYREQENAIKDTWAKSIINKQFDNVEWYSYVGDSVQNYTDEPEKQIHLKANDSFGGTFEKTKKCFSWIDKHFDFDYVVRTNCSTYLNIPLIDLFIQQVANPDLIYTSMFWVPYADVSDRNIGSNILKFISGSLMILPRNVVKTIANCSYVGNCETDDHAISKILMLYYGSYNEYFTHTKQLPCCMFDELTGAENDKFAIRCKTSNQFNEHNGADNIIPNMKTAHAMPLSNNVSFNFDRDKVAVGIDNYQKTLLIPIEKAFDKDGKFDLKSNAFVEFPEVREDKFRNRPSSRLKCAIITMAKEENAYIRDWVEYHLNIGFDKIFICDNNDIEGERFQEVINDYIESGKVQIIDRRGEVIQRKEHQGLQELGIEEVYNSNRKSFDWIAVIDCDEYIDLDSKYKNSIKKFLAQKCFHDCDIIKMKWQIMDDNGLIEYENKPVMERFTHIAKANENNRENKSIYRTCIDNFKLMAGTHTIQGDFVCCNTAGKYMVYNAMNMSQLNDVALTYDCCRLKHFIDKTVNEFIKRRLSSTKIYWQDDYSQIKRVEEFFQINEQTPEKKELLTKAFEKWDSNRIIAQKNEYTPKVPINKDNLKIFIMAHKDFKCPVKNKDIYRIVDATGKDTIGNNYPVPVIRTYEGTSISENNDILNEFTGIYWIWKNFDWSHTEYVGLCHYRRFFSFLDNPDYDAMKNDVVFTSQTLQSQLNNAEQYVIYHRMQDFKDCLLGMHSNEFDICKDYLMSKESYPANLLILSKEKFFSFCQFVFGYIFKMQSNYNLKCKEDVVTRIKQNIDQYRNKDVEYQSRMLGFICERLGNIWIMKQKKTMPLEGCETEQTGQGAFKHIEVQ